MTTDTDADLDADLGNACAGLPDATIAELRAIARQYDEAGGLLLKVTAWAGDKVSDLLSIVPADWQARVEDATELALREAYRAAAATQPAADAEASGRLDRVRRWATGETWHKAASAVTGALGGAGGIWTTLVDLPVTVTLMLRAIQQIAADYGEDIRDEQVRADCLSVFAFGGPSADDDSTEAGLVATRLALSGKAVAEMLRVILPRFSIVVSEKALAQAVPVLGAVAGAAINPAFTGYYQAMAHVHFRLRRLERDHDGQQLRACLDRLLRLRRDQPRG